MGKTKSVRIRKVHFRVHVKPDMNAENLNVIPWTHVLLVIITVTKKLRVRSLMTDLSAHVQKDLLELMEPSAKTLTNVKIQSMIARLLNSVSTH